MAEEKYGIVAAKSGVMFERTAQIFDVSHAKQKVGEFILMSEFTADPLFVTPSATITWMKNWKKAAATCSNTTTPDATRVYTSLLPMSPK
jgi:hypothetical protein